MKWFDKWFLKKARWAWSIPQEKEEDEGPSLDMTPNSGELESRGINFTLHNANGGYVIELRHYDEKADRMKNSLHIVPHDKDLGESLNHIITYEALKR